MLVNIELKHVLLDVALRYSVDQLLFYRRREREQKNEAITASDKFWTEVSSNMSVSSIGHLMSMQRSFLRGPFAMSTFRRRSKSPFACSRLMGTVVLLLPH